MHDDQVTVLVEFSLADPQRAGRLAAEVAGGIAETFTSRDGFRSATLLVSTDGKRMVNLARWDSEEQWLAATRSPDGQSPPADRDENPDWLARRSSDEPVARILAEGGATLERVNAFRTVRSVVAGG